MTASNSQQEQQSQSVDGSHAQLALIGLYVLADNQLTKLMGKVMRLLRRASTPVDVAHAVSMMRRGERRIVDQLERQTPQLLDTLTLSVERTMITEARRLPRGRLPHRYACQGAALGRSISLFPWVSVRRVRYVLTCKPS